MSLTLQEYHTLAMRTSPRDGHDKFDNGKLGLIGETGEIVDLYKKFKYQSGPDAVLSVDRFADELGDVLWYLVELADGMGANIADITKVDFDNLIGPYCNIKQLPPLRKAVVDIGFDAMAIEHSRNIDCVKVYMCTMLEHAAILACIIGVPMAEIAKRNIEKLKKRYPEGFDPAISEARYAHE